MRIISVEGNIGSGKSTFLDTISILLNDNEYLSKRVCLIKEPRLWYEPLDNMNMSPLDIYYNNIIKYAYTFQTYVTTSKYQHILHSIDEHEEIWNRLPDILIIERYSSFSDRRVFVQNLKNEGLLDDYQIEMYEYNVECLRDLFEYRLKIDLEIIEFIYIQTDIDTCMNRIQQRNSAGDNSITLNLLQNIHRLHDEWLGVGIHGNEITKYDDVLDQHHIIHYYENKEDGNTQIIVDFIVNTLLL